jgi:hypothetical protein
MDFLRFWSAGADCPFAQLGLAKTATETEVLRAWRRRMRDVHPDKRSACDSEAASTARAMALNESKERALALVTARKNEGVPFAEAFSHSANTAEEEKRRDAADKAAEETRVRRKRAAEALARQKQAEEARRDKERQWRLKQAEVRKARRVEESAAKEVQRKRSAELKTKRDEGAAVRQMERWRKWMAEMNAKMQGAAPQQESRSAGDGAGAAEALDDALLRKIAGQRVTLPHHHHFAKVDPSGETREHDCIHSAKSRA